MKILDIQGESTKRKIQQKEKNISIVKQFVHENIGYIQGGSPSFFLNRRKNYFKRETSCSLDYWIFKVKEQKYKKYKNALIKGYFLFFN